MMFLGMSSLPVVCHPARSSSRTACAPWATLRRDFVEVELHHVGVGVGKRQGRSDAARRADRAEQIGVVVALIGGLSWSRSAPGPLADEAVLLADPGFVLEPDFDRRRLGRPFQMGLQRAREVFLNASTIRSS